MRGRTSKFCCYPTKKILPDLEGNIKCGNSLVDTSYEKFNSKVFDSPELLEKLNLFNWETEFGGSKFDAVIGNPPYIRVQNMVHYSPDEYEYYKSEVSEYKTATVELLDKYYLFIERGMSLLQGHGILGYIIPHRFMNIKSGKELRKWLSENQMVKKILHFGIHQVFVGRSTYVCVLVLTKQRQADFKISFIEDWNRFLCEHTSEYVTYPHSYLTEARWTFLSPEVRAALDIVNPNCVQLDVLANIFVGVQTSADKIYILKPDSEDDEFVWFQDRDGKKQKIEKAILKKIIHDWKIKKYEKINPNKHIIFPYKIANGQPVLYSINEMKNLFPLTYKYLNQ